MRNTSCSQRNCARRKTELDTPLDNSMTFYAQLRLKLTLTAMKMASYFRNLLTQQDC